MTMIGKDFPVRARAFLLSDGVDEVRLRRAGSDVACDAQRLFDAVCLVPVGLLDLVAAEITEPGHVRHADRDVGVEQETEAARFGIVPAQLQDRIPPSRGTQFVFQPEKRAGAFVKKKDLVDVGIVFDKQPAAPVDDGPEMRLGKCFPQRLEND